MQKSTDTYNKNIVEHWWKHLGAYDREQASPLLWNRSNEDISDFFNRSDSWWDSLTDQGKMEIYNEFFEEN